MLCCVCNQDTGGAAWPCGLGGSCLRVKTCAHLLVKGMSTKSKTFQTYSNIANTCKYFSDLQCTRLRKLAVLWLRRCWRTRSLTQHQSRGTSLAANDLNTHRCQWTWKNIRLRLGDGDFGQGDGTSMVSGHANWSRETVWRLWHVVSLTWQKQNCKAVDYLLCLCRVTESDASSNPHIVVGKISSPFVRNRGAG